MLTSDSLDPIAYYNPEVYVFAELARRLAETGQIDPAALYLILDWKSPRARTRHLTRLAALAGGSFGAATRSIAADLQPAAKPEDRMRALLTKWGFRLPTASAILAVLYPEIFTVYDIRVCEALGDFRPLGDMKWSAEMWREYQRFIAAVRARTPSELTTLRDRDRWLWGKNKQERMAAELAKCM
jgi:hypothetical protein